MAPARTLLIACGALARETLAAIEANGLRHVEVTCVSALLHNRPERIPEAVRAKIREHRSEYERIMVLYADCGTGGVLDQVLAEEGVERIGGPHCYAFYSGNDAFTAIAEDEFSAFYLTDLIARQFEAFVIEPLKLDKHPELRDMVFGNYTKIVYLAQTDDPALQAKAKWAADYLGLDYEYRFTGYGDLVPALERAAHAA